MCGPPIFAQGRGGPHLGLASAPCICCLACPAAGHTYHCITFKVEVAARHGCREQRMSPAAVHPYPVQRLGAHMPLPSLPRTAPALEEPPGCARFFPGTIQGGHRGLRSLSSLAQRCSPGWPQSGPHWALQDGRFMGAAGTGQQPWAWGRGGLVGTAGPKPSAAQRLLQSQRGAGEPRGGGM